MLDLQPCIGFNKGKCRVVTAMFSINQEFERTQAGVLHLLGESNRSATQALSERRRQPGRRSDFHQLLVAALDAALTLAKMADRTGPITKDLDLNMPCTGNELFDIHIATAKGRGCFGLTPRVGRLKIIDRLHRPHTATTATRQGFNHHGSVGTQRCQELFCLVCTRRTGRPRQNRDLAFFSQRSRLSFIAKQRQRFDLGPNKSPPSLGTAPSELRVLAQKPIAGMNRIAARLCGQRNDLLDIEIGRGTPALER